MVTEELEFILPIAQSYGFLKPQKLPNPCYVSYINSANLILYHLSESESGLDTEQLMNRMNFSKNSINCYLRVFRTLNLVESEYQHQKPWIWKLKQN